MKWFILAQAVLMVWDWPIRPADPDKGVAWQSMVCDANSHFMYSTGCLMYGQAHREVKDCEANLAMAKIDFPDSSRSCVWLDELTLRGKFGQH